MSRSGLAEEIARSEPRQPPAPELRVPAHASAWQPHFHGLGAEAPPPAATWHPAMRRLLAGLPPLVRETLTPAQLEALSRATEPQPAPHLLSYRVSIPLPWRRYYLAVYFGHEKRNLKRLRSEGQTGVRPVSILVGVLLTTAIGSATIGLGLLLYAVKSAAGIDLLDGPSVLHDLFH